MPKTIAMSRRAGTVCAAFLLALLAACGSGGKSGEREPMKPEETVVGDLVTAPGRVEDRTNAAMEAHREALEQQINASEGGAPAKEE